jgi:hypothetical protein
MGPALWIGLALSAPPAEAEARFVEIALHAKKLGDAAATQKALRGWASLRRHQSLPVGVETEAADATSWAADAGQLRIYGSRLPGRVRVGVDDPALIVDRLDVFLAPPNRERSRLTRADTEAAGRNEYLVPETAVDMEIVVEAVHAFGKDEVVLRRAILVPSGANVVPEQPDPKKMAVRAGFKEEKVVPPPEPEPAFAWWWIAIGAVAAGLAGVAIYQEAKE